MTFRPVGLSNCKAHPPPLPDSPSRPEAIPYQWTNSPNDATLWRLRLWPHRSLPRRGFALFIGATSLMFLQPLFPSLGTPVLWMLLPFLMGTLALVWYFLQRSYADGALSEELSIAPDRVQLTRLNPRAPAQLWQTNTHLLRTTLHARGGPVANYITLSGGGREVELGAFLSPEERLELYHNLSDKLRAIDINAPRS